MSKLTFANLAALVWGGGGMGVQAFTAAIDLRLKACDARRAEYRRQIKAYHEFKKQQFRDKVQRIRREAGLPLSLED